LLGLDLILELFLARQNAVHIQRVFAKIVGSGFQPRGSDFGFKRYFWKIPTACLQVRLPHTCMS